MWLLCCIKCDSPGCSEHTFVFAEVSLSSTRIVSVLFVHAKLLFACCTFTYFAKVFAMAAVAGAPRVAATMTPWHGLPACVAYRQRQMVKIAGQGSTLSIILDTNEEQALILKNTL